MPSNNPSYQESKQVAEESREAEWKQPSFGREMYLGNFQLELIHPQPKADPDQIREGEEFLTRLRAFLTERVDPLQIEESGQLGDDVIKGLKDLGALGMKSPSSTAVSASPRSITTAPSRWPAPGTPRFRRCFPRISRSAYPSR
jgi:hypothetical protein